MEQKIVVQKLMKAVKTDLDMAMRYYSIISALNGLKLTNKQIQLLAFTAIRGTITPLSAREEFIHLFKTSKNSIENIKGQLVRKGLIVSVDGKYRVNPIIALNFSGDVVLQVNLKNEKNGTAEDTNTSR